MKGSEGNNTHWHMCGLGLGAGPDALSCSTHGVLEPAGMQDKWGRQQHMLTQRSGLGAGLMGVTQGQPS